MNRRAYLATTSAFLLAGCTGSDDPSADATPADTTTPSETSDPPPATDAPTETTAETTTAQPTIMEPDPVEFSGTGQRVTDSIPIQGGFTAFHLTHTGQSNFIIELQDASTAEMRELLANEIGSWQGNIATGLAAGEYLLDVTADGNWTAEIRQPRPGEADAHQLPIEVADAYPNYAGPIYFPGGTRILASYAGESNFIVQLLNAQGELVDLAFNEIGAFEGETTFAGEGYGWLQVKATGDWMVTLEPL